MFNFKLVCATLQQKSVALASYLFSYCTFGEHKNGFGGKQKLHLLKPVTTLEQWLLLFNILHTTLA